MMTMLRTIDQKPAGALALSAAAILLGLAVPPLPLLRRGALRLALLAAAVWILFLVIFFFVAFGPGLLGHIALWIAASIAMLLPKRLVKLEASLPRFGAPA